MKKGTRLAGILVISLLLISIISVSFVSASWFNDFWGKITGAAGSGEATSLTQTKTCNLAFRGSCQMTFSLSGVTSASLQMKGAGDLGGAREEILVYADGTYVGKVTHRGETCTLVGGFNTNVLSYFSDNSLVVKCSCSGCDMNFCGFYSQCSATLTYSACTPATEICDNKDNDCDGSIDEGDVCATCTDQIMLVVDSDGRNMIVFEAQPVFRDEYVVIGNEDEGHLLKVTSIVNQTTGYSQDRVRFSDVLSGDTFDATLTGEGVGTLVVGGKVYGLGYYGASTESEDSRYIVLDYPDSSGTDTAIVYPTMETSKGAKLFFYKPLTINLNDWDGNPGNQGLSKLKFPDGDGYTNITITSSSTLLNVGVLKYNLTSTGAGSERRLYLISPEGGNIVNPALVLFEERDDQTNYEAVIITLEPGATANDGVGVDDVVRTWCSDNNKCNSLSYGNEWDNVALYSNSKLAKDADLWGTIATVDSTDSDQAKATISYPDEQVNAQIYIGNNSEMEPLFTGTRIYVNDSLNEAKTAIARQDLPTILANGNFSGNVDATYVQTITIGKYPQVSFGKMPTSSNDPEYGLSMSTSTDKILYNLTITFNKQIDLSNANSKGKEITLFGQEYTIGTGTDATNLVLFKGAINPPQEFIIGGKRYICQLADVGNTSTEKITLTDASAVTKGEDDTVIDGTKVKFYGTINGKTALSKIEIEVTAPDSDHDAIKPGEAFVDPIFGTFKLDFAGLNIPDDSITSREDIIVRNSGDDKMEVVFTPEGGTSAKAVQFAVSC